MSGHTVLIVEDEKSLRDAIRDKLTRSGVVVLEAEDGAQGLQVALAKQPDLILLDILMSKMDGIEMLRQLRADDRGKTIQVILLTNLNDINRLDEALTLGARDYLIKSDIKLEDLVKAIQDRIGV
jgi:CheY-like chemotaxis protein